MWGCRLTERDRTEGKLEGRQNVKNCIRGSVSREQSSAGSLQKGRPIWGAPGTEFKTHQVGWGTGD